MLAGSDQVQILSFDLVHHGIHFRKTHNSGHYVAPDHKRWYAVSKSTVDHEISCIRNDCGMQPCNIAHQIVKSITGNLSCTVHINPAETFHDLCMIGNLEVGNHRLAKPLNFNVFTVVFSDRHGRIYDIRNSHHILFQLLFHFFFFYGKSFYPVCIFRNLTFQFFCFFLFSLRHQTADLLGNLILFCTERFYLLFDLPVPGIQLQDLINQR